MSILYNLKTKRNILQLFVNEEEMGKDKHHSFYVPGRYIRYCNSFVRMRSIDAFHCVDCIVVSCTYVCMYGVPNLHDFL